MAIFARETTLAAQYQQADNFRVARRSGPIRGLSG
jgi:hypothetical protein